MKETVVKAYQGSTIQIDAKEIAARILDAIQKIDRGPSESASAFLDRIEHKDPKMVAYARDLAEIACDYLIEQLTPSANFHEIHDAPEAKQ